MTIKGGIFVVSAPSGSGKTTIVERLLNSLAGMTRSISCTTRTPRPLEQNARDYYFISEKEFLAGINKQRFLEWEKNFGYYYGTPRDNLEKETSAGKDVILTIDVKGAAKVKKALPESVLIFVMPPSLAELKRRLKKRATDKKKDIANRLAVAQREIKCAAKFDYMIINDKIDKAVEALRSVVIAERCKINKRSVTCRTLLRSKQ